jgi:hypothetical protein
MKNDKTDPDQSTSIEMAHKQRKRAGCVLNRQWRTGRPAQAAAVSAAMVPVVLEIALSGLEIAANARNGRQRCGNLAPSRIPAPWAISQFPWLVLRKVNIKMLKVFRVDCVPMISATRAAKHNHVLR